MSNAPLDEGRGPDARRLSRREVLAGGMSSAALFALSASSILRSRGPGLVQTAASVKPAGSDLGAVEHVIFLMHENRSFDHYFGTLGGVNGFDTPSAAFTQAWPGGQSSTLLPFHLDTLSSMAECTFDISHAWEVMHACWNNGGMDRFVATHTSTHLEGQGYGPVTMGYYTENDIPFYYALARNFTICDNYFCSVLGPTHPNRLMQMSGTLDPAGVAGGPVLVTNSDERLEFRCSWDTMPEILEDAGVSWKVYNPPGKQYQPLHTRSMELCKNVLMYFKQYQARSNGVLHRKAFEYYGPNVSHDLFSRRGPNNFAKDVARNRLPAVSWMIPPDGYDEHPPAPPAFGEWYTAQVLSTLMSNPAVWAKTVVFVMYDENDGFFDHVSPPTAPPGTPGEYVTKSPLPSQAGGVVGPIGMGVRVPMLVVSPFSAGGWVCSDVFDHTSQLQFVAERFGVQLPSKLSAWRKATAGDLTATLPRLTSPVTTVPTLPATSESTTMAPFSTECTPIDLLELNASVPAYPVPAVQSMPTQGPNTLQPTPS